MHQTNEWDVFKQEITELKADHKTLEQRVITLERASDRHDQQIMSINDKLNKIEEKHNLDQAQHNRRDHHSGLYTGDLRDCGAFH